MMVRQHRDSVSSAYQSPPLSATGHRSMGSTDMHLPSAHSSTMYSQQGSGIPGAHGTTLPPFSSLESMGPPRSQPSNVSSMRFHPADRQRANGPEAASGSKRPFPPSSTVTSADSTDAEEDDGELPASGLVAPWEVLRGLADVAIERAAQVKRQSCVDHVVALRLSFQENGEGSEPMSRPRTSSPEPRHRPAKRRKVQHKQPGFTILPDGMWRKHLLSYLRVLTRLNTCSRD